MRQFIKRLRVGLARFLLKGDPDVTIVRSAPVAVIQYTAARLREYVLKSGGLSDPKRIRAYKTVLLASSMLYEATTDLVLGLYRHVPGQLESFNAEVNDEKPQDQ